MLDAYQGRAPMFSSILDSDGKPVPFNSSKQAIPTLAHGVLKVDVSLQCASNLATGSGPLDRASDGRM